MEFALYFIPQGRPSQRLFNQFIHVTTKAVDFGAPSDVVIDTFGEGIRFLKNHADMATHLHWVYIIGIDILATKENFPFDTCACNQVIHAIKRAQHATLATTRGADHRCNLVALNRQVYIAYGMEIAIVDV